MIKLSFCLRRLPHLSLDAFQTYWRTNHAPLVAAHAEVLQIRRYVQTHALATPFNDAIGASRNAPVPFDGIAELWFDSIEAMIANGARPEAVAAGQALLEDERKFIDLPRSPLWMNVEHEIVPLRRGTV